jgi:hypothetical protein
MRSENCEDRVISIAELLAVIASLVTIAAGVAVAIRYIFPRSTTENRFRLVAATTISMLVIVALAFFATSTVANQLGAGGQILTIQQQGSSTATATTQATPSPAATLQITPSPTPQQRLGDGTVVINKEVTCVNCNATYKVVLQKALINTNLENAQITFQVTNRTGSTSFLHFSTLTLTDSQNHTFSGTGDNDIFSFQTGATKNLLETFPLVPNVGEAYTLSLAIATNANYVDPLQYDPLSFMFQ